MEIVHQEDLELKMIQKEESEGAAKAKLALYEHRINQAVDFETGVYLYDEMLSDVEECLGPPGNIKVGDLKASGK